MRWPVYSCIIGMLFVVLTSCSTVNRIRTGPAVEEGVLAGTYRLILFGCGYLEDPETIAFLDREDDALILEPYAPDFRFSVSEKVPAAEALERARQFVACSSSFTHSQMTSILDGTGRTLGYEVRPLYQPLTYGVDDIVRVDYRLRKDRVLIYIRPIPSVEHMLGGGDSDRDN